MQERTSDRRTVRTKKLLREALIALIEEKGLESISVSDLTSRADINRGTFYLHYRDVFDMLDQLQREVLDGLFAITAGFELTEIIDFARRREAYPGLVALFEYWDRNADFVGVMFGPKGDPSFVKRVKDMMKERLYGKVHEIPLSEQVKSNFIPLDFVMAFVTSANLGCVQHWFETGRRLPPSEFARMMTLLVSQGPLAATTGIRFDA